MQPEKETLIRYRIDRCHETMEEAEKAINDDHLYLASNRIYYAIFYIVSALAQKNDFVTSKHSGLLGWFNKEYINPGIISKEKGSIYNKAFQNRVKGDYDDLVYFSKEGIIENYNKMKTFVEEVKKLLE